MIALLFLAGLVSEAIVTAQTRAISEARRYHSAAWAFAGWMLWGLVLSELVVSYWNVVPFAAGAALGTWLASKRR